MHSPPRAVSAKEQQDWKIPPCISNWKNAKGYTIPLDKRLAADGRGLQETAINDGFAKFTEALYVAEQNARQVRRCLAAVRHSSWLLQEDACFSAGAGESCTGCPSVQHRFLSIL